MTRMLLSGDIGGNPWDRRVDASEKDKKVERPAPLPDDPEDDDEGDTH